VAFSKDGEFWLAGDKFGDVLAARTATEPAAPAAAAPGWELMLGHYCSLLTSVTVSATGRLVATTDRDQKVRVSVMPADPTQGAHSIQAYCFGHTAFVTCSAFARAGEAEVLLSGGGDGTLRMWDPLTGTALCSLELEPAAAAAAGGGGDAAVANAVLAVAVAPDGRHAVALVDGRDELCVVSLDVAGGSMAAQGWHPLPGLHIATSVCFDTASRVWAAGGPPAAASLCGFVACGEITAEGGLAAAAEGGGALTAEERAKLEARDGSEGAVLAEAAAGRRSHLAGYLRKRSVSQHEDESRKKEKFGERA
jgi:tRNA (guanine-N(7)-)-methyltransferase subunit TRM82